MKRLAIVLAMMLAAAAAVPQTNAQQAAGSDNGTASSATSRPSGSDRQSTGRRRRSRQTETFDTTATLSTSAPMPLATELDVLTQRSIFVKGRNRGGGSSGGDSGPSRPEDVLVFNGVTQSDNKSVAFIEDTSTQKVQVVQVGEAIAQGKIVKITLDGLEYQPAQGSSVHVLVGQNLRGRDAWNQTYGLGSESTVESTASETPSSPAMAALILRMKQKRLQELGGGAPSATTAPSAGR